MRKVFSHHSCLPFTAFSPSRCVDIVILDKTLSAETLVRLRDIEHFFRASYTFAINESQKKIRSASRKVKHCNKTMALDFVKLTRLLLPS